MYNSMRDLTGHGWRYNAILMCPYQSFQTTANPKRNFPLSPKGKLENLPRILQVNSGAGPSSN